MRRCGDGVDYGNIKLQWTYPAADGAGGARGARRLLPSLAPRAADPVAQPAAPRAPASPPPASPPPASRSPASPARASRTPASPSAPASPAPAAAGPASAVPEAIPARRARSRRGVRPLTLLFVLLAAVAGYAAVVATRGDGTRRVSASLTEDEVRAAAHDFADAYGAEDAAALRSTLASNVQRVAPDGSTQGREAVLAVYRRQFATSDVDAYELGDLQVVRGAAGRAAGSYTVKRSGRDDIKGRVAFGVIREDGQPRIAMIATQPE